MYVSAVTEFSSALRAVLDSIVEIRAYDVYYENLDQYLSVPEKLREGEMCIRDRHQRALTVAIKRARHIALMPYVTD